MSNGATLQAVGLIVSLSLAACTSTPEDEAVPNPSASPSVSVSPSPTKAPKPPKVSEARLDGRYKVRFVVINTTFQGGTGRSISRWVFEPKCSANRPCNTRMESLTGDYEMTFAYIHGKYRGVASRHFDDDECGRYNVKNEYVIIPTKAELIAGFWTATVFRGSNSASATGGTCLPAQERDTMKGTRT
jgi:hypothetical protein